MRVEDRVREELARAVQRLRNTGVVKRRRVAALESEGFREIVLLRGEHSAVGLRRYFIEAQTNRVSIHDIEQDVALERLGRNRLRLTLFRHRQGVEEGLVLHREAGGRQPCRKLSGVVVDALSDSFEALRSVIDGIHRCHDSQQNLCRTDVGGRLLTADVLLARLQRETVGGVASGILRYADEAAGKLAFEPLAH